MWFNINSMNFAIILILSIPSGVLYWRYRETDIIYQLIIILVLLLIGWKVIRSGGCLRLLGLLMLILGLAGYYYLIIQPFLTGSLTTINY